MWAATEREAELAGAGTLVMHIWCVLISTILRSKVCPCYAGHREPARPPQPCPAIPLPCSFGRKGQAVQARAAHSRWGEALNELGRMQVRTSKPH